MEYNDLREYMEIVDRLGELRKIENAHWNEEIGALTEIEAENYGPFLLFD